MSDLDTLLSKQHAPFRPGPTRLIPASKSARRSQPPTDGSLPDATSKMPPIRWEAAPRPGRSPRWWPPARPASPPSWSWGKGTSGDALRGMPAANPRIRRARNNHSRGGAGRRQAQFHAGRIAALFVRARPPDRAIEMTMNQQYPGRRGAHPALRACRDRSPPLSCWERDSGPSSTRSAIPSASPMRTSRTFPTAVFRGMRASSFPGCSRASVCYCSRGGRIL